MSMEERLESMEMKMARMGGELERSRRRNRFLVTGAILALGAAGLIFWASMQGEATAQFRDEPAREEAEVADEIRARKIFLVDEQDQKRIEMNVDDEGPKITLFDHNEKERVVLGIINNAGLFGIVDENEYFRIGIGSHNNSSTLVMGDSEGNIRVSIDVENGETAANLFDRNDNLRASLVVDDDDAELTLTGDDQKYVISSEGSRTEETARAPRRPRHIPREVFERPVRVIDAETLEIRETTVGKFELEFELDPQTGYRRDDEGRLIVSPTNCMACEELIPPTPIPIDATPEEYERLLREYNCPKCGERAIEM